MENLRGVLKDLECPVCLNYMIPPIMQCVNGHNICNTCKPELTKCPTCEGHLIHVRNELAEHLAENFVHPCRYENLGCARNLVLGTEEEHEQKCRYGPHKCPFAIVDGIKCEWEGLATLLENHIAVEHAEESKLAIISSKGKETLYIKDYIKQIENGSWYSLVFALDKMFLSYSKNIDNFFFQCFMFVGGREDMKEFKCKVKIKREDVYQSVSSCFLCPHYQQCLDEEFPNPKYSLFSKDFTKLCVDTKGRLAVKFKISMN